MRIFKQVPRMLFGQGALENIEDLLPETKVGYRVYIIDSVHHAKNLHKRLPIIKNDFIEWFDTTKEPSTKQVDDLKYRLLHEQGDVPSAIIGIGGGSTMDLAKALSVVLTNPGSSEKYQGWDLVKYNSIFKIGVPTVAGSGAEASRTAVLMGQNLKFGINSDQSMFDCLIMDSTLIKGVPLNQWFHSGMDCFIHCVESLEGTMINELAKAYAKSALELCQNVFLGNGSPDELMTASFMGGCSIVNSEVGVCHALSYGLSMELGYRHGLANCVAFSVLDEFYGDYVDEFRQMARKHEISIPQGEVKKLDEEAFERMIKMTLRMERPLENALGKDWHSILTPDKITQLYQKM